MGSHEEYCYKVSAPEKERIKYVFRGIYIIYIWYNMLWYGAHLTQLCDGEELANPLLDLHGQCAVDGIVAIVLGWGAMEQK